ncbi:response regulator [Chitinophaga oryzae]|uniref:histidine kinase n=1 Tax=Chitinophaga oryzae TaxID=2725414 RepID=A0AAE6ZMX5_9BACT|nr:ATP-binding protein [Chitinophaga oryzae]QJB34888.1 response regulator [Chitinophaga oryzae]QJB41399.1 response regulator [Chitinophaga oryzae]
MKTTTILPRPVIQLLNTGVHLAKSAEAQRAVVLINAAATLTCILALITGLTIYYITSSIPMLLGVLAETSCFVGVIVLNKYGRHNLAAGVTLLIHCTFALYFGALLGPAMPLELITVFLLSFLTGGCYLIYRDKKIRVYLLVIILIVFSVMLTNNYTKLVEPIHIQSGPFLLIKGFCCISILTLMGFVVVEIINQNDKHKDQAALKLIELKQENKEIVAESEKRINYLYEAAHDMRTPISAVISFAETIEWDKVNNPDVVDTITKISKSGTIAREILNNTLDLAKLATGEFDVVNLAPMDLRATINDCLLVNSHFASKCNSHIALNYGKLPTYIISDGLFIKRLLNNVFSNAIKFSPEGSQIDLSIAITEEKLQERLLFTVSNPSKIPIDEIHQKIGRFKSERNQFENTGLGIGIIKELVKKLKGSCLMETDAKNVHFHFKIPFTECSPEQIASLKEMNKSSLFKDAKDLLVGRSVIIIEDDSMMTFYLSKWCIRQQASYRTYKDGNEGLNALMEGSLPDLLILDHKIPGLTGDLILYNLRYKDGFERMKIIINSACSDPAIHLRYKQFPGITFLTKPLDLAVMNAAIVRWF